MVFRKSYFSVISLKILNGPRFNTKIQTVSGVILLSYSAQAWLVSFPQWSISISNQPTTDKIDEPLISARPCVTDCIENSQ